MDDGTNAQQDSRDDSMRPGEPAKKKLDKDGHGKHKRSISGGITGSLPFLRASAKAAPLEPLSKREDRRQYGTEDKQEGVKRGSSIANALRQSQGRRRKASLRKGILGKNMMRERRNSQLVQQAPTAPPTINANMDTASPDDDDDATPRRFSYENASLNSSSDSGWAPTSGVSVANGSLSHHGHEHLSPQLLASTLTSPAGAYASTTDDDEGISFFKPTAANSSSYNTVQLQPPGPAMSLQRRRSNRSGQLSSLTIAHTPADADLDDEWDYSETEWWGWVVLVVTWIVFVVGMGSCLGVWSWAWDVGETPYAPPELEDDPTLPITGYYPALMVCTAVMAWVWVVVAWVGMKYFRHAKVVGDD